MSSDVKTQVVWLPDGFGGGGHAEVCRASDYAALEAECAELYELLDRQSDLLKQTAIALRGPEPDLTRYSHADIPERVKLIVAERDALAAELAAIKGQEVDGGN